MRSRPPKIRDCCPAIIWGAVTLQSASSYTGSTYSDLSTVPVVTSTSQRRKQMRAIRSSRFSRGRARIYRRGRGPERYRGRGIQDIRLHGVCIKTAASTHQPQVYSKDSINDRSVRTYITCTAGGDATVGLALSFANFQVDAGDKWHIALYDDDILGGGYETESHQLNNEACSIVVMGSGKRVWR